MMIKTKITELLNIDFPIIQGGMVWVSGWKLASAVSNNGGLGLIGAGSMKPDLLSEHIRKCKNATDKPFGVNLPLLREDANSLADVIIKENVKIVFTSAGHPGKFIDLFKKHNIIPNTEYLDTDKYINITNGRILYVLLPALKVDPRSLSSLGKIVLSLFKVPFQKLAL